MLKERHGAFSIIQRGTDILAVLLAWWLSYLIRFVWLRNGLGGISILGDAQSEMGLFFIQIAPVLMILSLISFQQNGLYRSLRFSSRFSEILAVFKANNIALMLFILILYFFFRDKVSRVVILSYFILSHFILVAVRISVRNFLRILRKRGHNLRHVLLVGNGRQLQSYIETIRRFKDAGIRFVGWIDSDGQHDRYAIPLCDQSISLVLTEKRPDIIVIGYPGKESEKVELIVRENYNDVTPIQILPDISYSFIGHEIADFEGLPIITLNEPKFGPLDMAMKRLFDAVVTGIGLICISPLMALLACLVKLSSPGPILYGQERMGLDGKTFKMWKFRSMRVDAESQSGAVWAKENDPRRTRIGTFLRASSLDELPQLWNVLVGDMSLVGPRPERPVFVDQFRHQIPAYMLRHKMKAGVTGWAQVNGWRGNTSLEKRIECDIYYIKNWSLWFDVKIIFLTFWKGFIHKNAY